MRECYTSALWQLDSVRESGVTQQFVGRCDYLTAVRLGLLGCIVAHTECKTVEPLTLLDEAIELLHLGESSLSKINVPVFILLASFCNYSFNLFTELPDVLRTRRKIEYSLRMFSSCLCTKSRPSCSPLQLYC